MIIFYFSSTGNSLYIAKSLSKELISIPKVIKKEKTYKASQIGFIFPCYYGGTPKIVKKFIEKNNFKSDYTFAIMTYGNFQGRGINHFEKIAKNHDLYLNYTNEILMIDNYIPLFDIKNEIKNNSQKSIDRNIKIIKNDLKLKIVKKVKKNIFMKIISFFMELIYNIKKGNVDKKFIINDDCDLCGVCKKICPVNNIIIDKKPIYNHRCIECMGCINLCPQNAIHHKNEKSSARFKNSNIKLKEIIDSSPKKS